MPWEGSQKFVAAFKTKYSRVPTSLAAQGYDSARLMFDAIGRAAEPKPTLIRDAIAQTKGFQGATGVMTVDANRNVEKPIVVVKITGGKFTYAGQVTSEKSP